MKKNNIFPEGAGRYGFIRSSKDVNAMLFSNEAHYDENSELWFEHIGCEYESYEDGRSLRLDNEYAIRDFMDENPTISCREVYYVFDYSENLDMVDGGMILFTEYQSSKVREFLLIVKEGTLQDVEEYIEEAFEWHVTGRFRKNSLEFFPCAGPWKDVSNH